ncbi:G-type lectin S-receptor-like serine/threonine-protein kinase RKS1 [Prunus avium]|uniref:G-type lectin S-receptor-like serine/threonine-protein kinase RKS1 n=1 Tax=Prunus avium TaxID=42229 RepID=A0A6P5SCE9_PRUAV|nr:G-type lectin S-receptor-like serine/threonine-protein kinase RKS1 [Prunus avium]
MDKELIAQVIKTSYSYIRANGSAGSGKDGTELPLSGLKSILAATNNFSEANKLGEGGFGPVYKGILLGNEEVTIKRLSKKSGQGHEEFMNELKLIAKLQHTNLVRLLGFCNEKEGMILNEYMPNRSLDKLCLISAYSSCAVISKPKRLNFCIITSTITRFELSLAPMREDVEISLGLLDYEMVLTDEALAVPANDASAETKEEQSIRKDKGREQVHSV